MREAVVVASSRTPLAKSQRGSFNITRPDDLAAHCITDALGNGAQWTYDSGISSVTIDPLGAAATRHIDNAGRVITAFPERKTLAADELEQTLGVHARHMGFSPALVLVDGLELGGRNHVDGLVALAARHGAARWLTADTHAYFRSHYIQNEREWSDWRASPLLHKDLSKLPPALVLTAGFDPLRDEGRQYADALSKSGVQTQCVCFERQIHGFITMGRVIDEANTAVALCAFVLRRTLVDA